MLLDADSALLVPLGYLDLSVGVDLFLVISGFVITGSILESTRGAVTSRRPLMFSLLDQADIPLAAGRVDVGGDCLCRETAGYCPLPKFLLGYRIFSWPAPPHSAMS